MPAAVKRRLELCKMRSCSWSRKVSSFQSLSPIVEAANGIQHIRFSGKKRRKVGLYVDWERARLQMGGCQILSLRGMERVYKNDAA